MADPLPPGAEGYDNPYLKKAPVVAAPPPPAADLPPGAGGFQTSYAPAAPAPAPAPVALPPDSPNTDYSLKRRSFGEGMSDIGHFLRVAGNQAIVPGTLDNVLSVMPGAGDIDYQRAQTKAAGDAMDPSANAIAKFWGQNASVARFMPTRYSNNPVVQGLITGLGGDLMQGETDPLKLGTDTATSTGGGVLGRYAGSLLSAGAKAITDRTPAAMRAGASKAQQAALDQLDRLDALYRRGRNVADEAGTAATNAVTSGAKRAYETISDAAARSTEPGYLQHLAGLAGSFGLTPTEFGPMAPWAVQSVIQPTIGALNRIERSLDVRSAIDQASPAVAGVVKTAIDPAAWRNAIQSFAIPNADSIKSGIQSGANAAMSWTPPWSK